MQNIVHWVATLYKKSVERLSWIQTYTSRRSWPRSFQIRICLGWSGKVPLILGLQTRFFREKRKKNLVWSSRGKGSCLKGKTKKNLFRITRYSIFLERQARFFRQKRKKILARSSSWTSRAVFVHERLYIRASLRHLFIWTRRQRTVSASNMTKILFPFFAGAACWSRVSRCVRWKVYLSRLTSKECIFRSHGLQRLAAPTANRASNEIPNSSDENDMKHIVEIRHLSIRIFVTLEFYLQINNSWHLPIVFSLISMGEKENGIERRIQASKNQSRKTREQETGKITRKQESCLAK